MVKKTQIPQIFTDFYFGIIKSASSVFHSIVDFNRKARKGLRKVRKVLGFEVNLCLFQKQRKKSALIRFYLRHPCSIYAHS